MRHSKTGKKMELIAQMIRDVRDEQKEVSCGPDNEECICYLFDRIVDSIEENMKIFEEQYREERLCARDPK